MPDAVPAAAAPKKRRRRMAERVETPFYQHFLLPLTFGIYQLLRGMLDRMSPRHVYLFARGFAAAAWLMSSRHRQRAVRNLEIAYGPRFTPEQRHRIARRVVDHFFMSTMDAVLIPRLAASGRWRNVVDLTPEQERALDELQAHQGPVAFHTAHLGSWEMSAALAGFIGKKLNFVYRPLEHPQVDAELRKIRTVFGNEVFAKKGALRGYMRTLRDNGWLGVIADQNAGTGAAFLDFFGVAASTEVRHFPLYMKFKPRVITLFTVRDGNNYRFRMEGPFETAVNPAADPNAEAMRLGQWYLDRVREVADRHPEQYLWTHKRYTSRPAGAPSLYNNPGQPLDPAVLAAQPKAPIPPSSWTME
jgi:KDO2-lipid IV(A) lauroyltransferase